MEHIYAMALDKLFLWCAENDLMIELGAKHTEYDYADDIVFLENYDTAEETLYSLLHECGHFLIQNADDYHIVYRDKLRPQSPTDWYCGFIREEQNAWSKGYELALGLGLRIDSGAFEALSRACLEAYHKALLVHDGVKEKFENLLDLG